MAVPICHDDIQTMRVIGGVDLPGAHFAVSFCYLPAEGKAFRVIDNDGTGDPVYGSRASSI